MKISQRFAAEKFFFFLLFTGFLSGAFCAESPVVFQNSKIINLNSPEIEWQKLEMIKAGENIPTAVHSMTASEARFYGFTVETPEIKKNVFVKPFAQFQPFAVAWKNLDTDEDIGTKNFALRKRMSIEEEIIAVGVSFGTENLFGHLQFDFSTQELVARSGASRIFGVWNIADYIGWMVCPVESYLSWAGENVSVSAGRFKTGIGLGEENMVLNGQAVFYDNVQFSWWGEKLKFFSMLGTSSSHLTKEEWKIQKEVNDDLDSHDASIENIIPFKMFTYHRLEYKPFKRFGIGMTEMQLLGGKIPDLFNILPMTVWHNTYTAGVTNVMFQVDAWAVPINGLLVSGEFLIDDMRVWTEKSYSKPNSFAWDVNALYVLPVSVPEWNFFVNAEYSHADTWTYTRWQPYLCMYQRQLYSGGFSDSGMGTPLGHSEGGDVDVLKLSASAVFKDKAKFTLGYKYITKGPVYIGQNHNGEAVYYRPWNSETDPITAESIAEAINEVLSRPHKKSHCILFDARWKFTLNIEFSSGVDVRFVSNSGHKEGNDTLEMLFKTGVVLKI